MSVWVVTEKRSLTLFNHFVCYYYVFSMFRVCRYCGQRERMSKQMYMCSHRVGVNVSKFSAFECTLVLVSSVLFRIYFSRNVKFLYVYNVCVVVVSCCYLQLLFECCFCSSGGCYSCCCFPFLFVLWFRAVFLLFYYYYLSF